MLIISLIITSVAHGQSYTKIVYTKPDGTKVGAIRYLPAPGPGQAGTVQPSGNLPAVVIYGSGIDHELNGTASFDTTTSGGVDILKSKSLPYLCYTNNIKYYRIPGTTGPTGIERIAMLAPQCKAGEDWEANYLIGAVNYIKSTLANLVDTNRIYYWGYSWGGIGAWVGLQNQFLRDNISYWFILSPGPWPSTFAYATIAASGVQVDVLQHRDDAVATQSWGEGPIAPLNEQSPVNPVQYWKLTTNSPTWFSDALSGANNNFHATWKWICYDTAIHTTGLQMNPVVIGGDTLARTELIPFERMLRFNKKHPHR